MSLSEKNLAEKMDQQEAAEARESGQSALLHPKKGAELVNLFKKGADFVHELIKENEKLRQTALKLQEQNEALRNLKQSPEAEALKKKLKTLEEKSAGLEKKYEGLRQENMEFANKFIEAEEQNNMLTNLYVASYQLHSSLDFTEVVRIVMEIIINLIGAERFAIMMMDEKTQILKAVSAEGAEVEDIAPVKTGDGVVGKAVASGEPYYAENKNVEEDAPIVCVPLKIKDKAIGAIVIYKLLNQKESFSDLDYELFTMLAGHTATAMFCSRLYGDSERRLTTIQGFIDLITK